MSDYSIAIKIGGKLEKSFTDALRAAQGGLSGMDSSVSKGAGTMGKFGAKAAVGMAVAAKAAQMGAAAIKAAGQAVVDVGKYSVQVGQEFETAMSNASATAGATTAEYDKMKQAAMEMGKTTSKTATESAQALEYMSLAGWDVDTSVSALPSVLKMSEASGMDLARTSDLVTDSMAALGVTVDELPGYLDMAAKAQTKSNQSAEQLMDAYLGVGGTMKNLNVPLEESATALGVMANRGIKGSEAGNALNAIMTNLTTGTGQAGKMMQQLGVSAFDSQGNFIGLEATLQQLNTALQGCSDEERNAAMAAIGGKQHVDALNDLMSGLNTTNEKGVSEWAALKGELDNCKGSLDAMRDTKLDNLEGDMAALESATQDAGIKIYEHLNTPLRDFAQFGTRAVHQVSGALEKDGFSGMAGAAGSMLADGLGMVVEHLPEFLATAAASLVTFVIGFATDLPSSILAGIIKGVPRLLKALPQIGISIIKAIAKGILSSGHTILMALKKLIFGFGGGGDKADAEKAGAEAAKGYADGAAADVPEGPGDTAAVAEAGAAGGEVLKAGAEQAKAGIPLNKIPPAEGTEAFGGDTSAIADASPALKAAVDTGMDAADIAGLEAQAREPAAIDQGDVVVDMPAEAIQAEAGAVTDTQAEAVHMSAETMPVSAEMSAMPGEVMQAPAEMEGMSAENTQAVAEIMGTPAESVQIPPGGIDTAEEEAPEIPPAGIVQETAQAQQETAAGIPAEAMTETPPAESMPSAEVVADASTQTAQVPVETMADVPPELMQETAETADVPAETVGIPAEAAADTEIAGSVPGTPGLPEASADMANTAASGAADAEAMPDIPAQEMKGHQKDSPDGENKAPRPGLGIADAGRGIAQAGKDLQDGVESGLAGKLVDTSRINVDSSALSGRMGLAGALGGQSFMDGITQNMGGTIDAPPVGITGGETTQASQTLPQEAGQAVPGEVLSSAAPEAAQDAAQAAGNPAQMPPSEAVPPAGPMAETAQTSPGQAADAASNRSAPVQTAQSAAGTPEPGAPNKGSGIGEMISALFSKFTQPSPAPGGASNIVCNLTINVEGSGDVKKDVPEAAQMGAREFEKLMDGYLRKNKRIGFA